MSRWIQKAVPKSHRGRFTAKAKKAGMGVQAFANKVLANKSRYSETTVRQASLAKRFKKMSRR